MIISLAIVFVVLFTFICGCPCGCILCSDDFNRADDTDINTGSSCGWTEVAGSWSIATNKLSTSSTSGIAIATVAGSDGVLISGAEAAASYGDKVRVIIDYVDSSNYHFAEWTPHASAPTLEIYRRAAGVDALVVSQTGTNNALIATVGVCISEDGNVSATVSGSTIFMIVSATTSPHGGTQGGVGTGATVSGSITFDYFSLRRAKTANVPCQACTGCFNCSSCENAEAPTVFAVALGGITNGSCMLCSGLNATYYPKCTIPLCLWTIAFPNVCGYIRMNVRFPTASSFRVEIENFLVTSFTFWIDTAASNLDCDELNSHNVPFSSATAPTCTFTGSTCLVTAR